MVKICAALAWYAEPPEFLGRCVRSLAGVADELVAVDGAWQHFPGGRHLSSSEEYDALYTAAYAAGVPLRAVTPRAVWESQVEKRAALMAHAAERSDWILVIDGDEYVKESEPQRLREELAKADLDVAYLGFQNLNRGETMPGTTPRSGLNRRLYRAGTTVRIVHSGYFYEGRNVLVADHAIDVRPWLTLEHDNVNRGPARNELAREYRRARHRHGVEVWAKPTVAA